MRNFGHLDNSTNKRLVSAFTCKMSIAKLAESNKFFKQFMEEQNP